MSENTFSDFTQFINDVDVSGNLTTEKLNDIKIQVVGSTLTFTVAGIGSTSLTLSWLILSEYFLIRRSGGNWLMILKKTIVVWCVPNVVCVRNIIVNVKIAVVVD